MDKQTLAAILERHISGNKLDLPADALGSDAVNAQFALFLPGENLLIDPIADRHDEDDSIVVTGTGQNSLFAGASVTARFIAADSAGLILQAQTPSGWTLAEAFPALEHTFAAQLKFKNAVWTLSAQTAAADGLSFEGAIDFAQSLGVFEFLLGSIDKTIGGSIDSIKDGVPLMRLASAALDGATLGFIKLGAIRIALLAQIVPPSRAGGATQAGAVLEISTALDLQAQGKTVEIPLTGGIYSSDSAIRFDADTSQVIDAGLDDLSALFNSIDVRDLAFGDFRLEDSVALSEFSFVVDPTADAKLQSVALTVNSKKNWDLLTRSGGDAFVTLENLSAFLGSSAPFAEEDFSASLKGEVLIGDARIAMHASAFSDSTTVEGILDSSSHLSLGEIARHFLGETGTLTPELSLNHLEFIVQPGQSYQLTSEVDDLWSIPLGDKTLEIESLAVDWQYAVGSDAKADIKGVIQFAGAEIDVEAKYDTGTGWNFSGALADGDTIEIGDLLADLFYFFNVEPPQFVETIKLSDLSVDFNTTSKNFDFTIGGGLPVDDKWLEITLKIAISENNDEFASALSGTLTIGSYEFDLAFLRGSSDNRFVAAYSYAGAPASLPLQSFFADHVSSTVAEFVPQNLSVDLKDVLFAFDSTTGETDASGESSTQTTFVFAFDLGTSIDLSNLPLVGKELSAVQTVSVDDLRLFAASAELTGAQIAAFNQIIPDDITKLPEPTDKNSANEANGNGQPSNDSTPKPAIGQGLTVSATINFGGDQRALSLTVGGAGSSSAGNNSASTASSAARGASVAAPPPDDAHWFTVQKTFGPVHFERIGVRYEDAVLTFLLDAALSAAGLTLSLEGLSVGSPLDRFAPQFNLNGLGIDYSNGAAEIGAAFLRNPLTEEYSGTAVIKTGQFNLAAIGSYSKLEGHPSLFIYGILDYPIGGPAFFFVTGLAAGFGYNRSLIVPPVGELAAFPLVAEAADPPGGEIDLTTELTSLQTYVPPSTGDMFLAVGVKFTSFKMIDSFALLAFSFGTRFEIDVLGLSTLIVPTPVDGQSATPLAEAQMALKATFIPDEGFLGVSAQLTSASYILSKACRLTGGYAFYSWFSGAHDGDFVQTLGGYHPSFNVPAHYPQVPRLGFNWRVSEQISITGALYYALTPSALMAGGFLQAVWEDGDLSAWFKAGADFLISWKPYHYDVEIYVDMGVSYTFNFFGRHTITVDIGADLHIWGPEFAGHAHIHLWIVSFDVSFGSTSAAAPPPLKWDEFRNSFLPPKNEDLCTINVKNGLVKGTKDRNDLGVINPKYLSVVTHSVIPSTEATTGSQTPGKKITVGDIAQIGIGSMAIAPGAFVSRHNITITRDGSPSESDFTFTPVKKNVPAGLWGDKLMPELNGQAVIENALTGFEITPAALPTPGATMLIDRRNLMYADPQIFAGAFGFENLDEFEADDAQDSDRKREIENTISEDSVAAARQTLLNSLGIDAGIINLSATFADAFVIPPLVQK